MNFFDRLRVLQEQSDSLLCVGIDPDIDAIRKSGYQPASDRFLLECFGSDIVANTAEFAPVFKPNAAFFSALDNDAAMKVCIEKVHEAGRLAILDAKRGDIGNTAAKYAHEAFVRYGADAVTVNPYMGLDTIEPFLEHEGKGVFVLCRTSNPGGSDFQNLVLENGLRLYEQVAYRMLELDAKYGGGRIGLVVGATFPSELERVRSIVGKRESGMTLLVPGIGAQGGDVEATVKAGETSDGFGMVINSSRGIIYASDMAKAARDTRDQINLYRSTVSA
ncbi:MAG: orotidine-5'-phosphate decarboxylase [Patescibacteria group bacterium]